MKSLATRLMPLGSPFQVRPVPPMMILLVYTVLPPEVTAPAVPLPRTRVRQVVTQCVVWDAQTVMLGGLISEDITNTKDKVPVLGDLPMVGRLFRSETKTNRKKNLVIFVTPTIIDPAGNRVHTDEEMPFAVNNVPRQTGLTR